MKRYKLIVEYDGTSFCGWQWQVHDISVQSVIENAIESLTKHPVTVYAAGRTDAGVHAMGQVVHFNTNIQLNIERLAASLNFFMSPHKVCIVEAYEVNLNFHARFSAISRSYIYKILRRNNPSVLLQNRAWQIPAKLDLDLMNAAAQKLIGKHDFTSFRSARCQSRSAIKYINKIDIINSGEIIEIHISAPSFLHNQVRIIMGTLKMVGTGHFTANHIDELLSVCDRTRSGPTAPPYGLYLCDVKYDKDYRI